MSRYVTHKKRLRLTNNNITTRKKTKFALQNEEVTSSESEDENIGLVSSQEVSFSEEECETAQEKKIRLAKVYLKAIEREEEERLEGKQIDKEHIAKRLKDDYLQQTGKLKRKEAAKYACVNIKDATVLKCREHNKTITCLCISADDEFVYSGSKDGFVVKWSLGTYKKAACIPFANNFNKEITGHSYGITCISVSSDNKFLAVGDESCHLQIWNPENLKHIKTLTGHRNMITGVCFKKNSHTLYTCSKDKSVKVWSLDEMTYVESLYGHQDMVTSIDTLYRDRVITAGGSDTSLRLWNILEESHLIYNEHSGSVDVVRLINEENFVSGGDDGKLCMWKILKKKPLVTVTGAHGYDPASGQPYWITSLACLLNSDVIGSGSSNGTVKIWKFEDGFRSVSVLFEIPVIGFVNTMSFVCDGGRLVLSTAKEHRFGRWNVVKSAKNTVMVIPLLK